MTKITAEMLHDAADKVGGMRDWPHDAEVKEFIDESEFDNHMDMDPVALAFGILIGITVMDNNDDKKE